MVLLPALAHTSWAGPRPGGTGGAAAAADTMRAAAPDTTRRAPAATPAASAPDTTRRAPAATPSTAAPDTVRRVPAAIPAAAAPDTTHRAPAAARADTARVRLKEKLFDEPRWVMARSLVIPGWGQFHNRAWIKAGVVAFSESYLVVRIVQDERALRDFNAQVNAARQAGDADAEQSAVDRYKTRLDRVVGREWLLAGLVTYALMDAYVDAHFVHFKFEFEHDPALPGGPPGGKIVLEKRF